MPKFVTPARLAAALGVLTGLAAAATSLAGALPHDTAVERAVVGAAGVLGTCITLVKWLDGQAKWEGSAVGQAQAVQAAAVASQPVFVAADGPTLGVDETYEPVSAGAPDPA